ncbi:MAG: hypothetical protein SCALA702_19640 [Melioribacteraceae bacterium]|nr:MAG: hypothetical protein SCALA702_19640 [Melioribacteraceae bacterium]
MSKFLYKLFSVLLITSLFTLATAQTVNNIEFVEIPSATFSMGEPESEYEGPPGSYDAAVHNVTLSKFWMSKTEITNLQYVNFLNEALTAGLVEVKVETANGPDKGKTLVFGTDSAPDEYKGVAMITLDGTRVMKDHDDGDGDGNPFTGVIEPENPLNLCYIGYDETANQGEKFFVEDPATDFDWVEETNYYNYTSTQNELDTTQLLNDYDDWVELSDFPNNMPTLEEVKNWPATFIRWYGAKAFAMFYNLDLPTEAQWEYAASGGQAYKYATPDGTVNGDGTSANWNFLHEEPALHHVYDVEVNDSNPFGLYNLAGNVWEWCEDWYKSDFYEDATDPVCTDPTSNKKVRRGGSWNYHESTLKAAARAEDEQFKGNDHFGFRVVSNSEITSVGSADDIPTEYQLEQNYPNPFNPSTSITYSLPGESVVKLTIYDILGNEIATLVNASQQAGTYTEVFNAAGLSSGLYLYRLETGNTAITKKMTLIK